MYAIICGTQYILEQALMIVDSSGEDDEVLEVADSEPEPEKLPLDDGEPLPDDIFLKMKAGVVLMGSS